MVDAHVGTMHGLDAHAVDALGLHACLFPDGLLLLRGERERLEDLLLGGELADEEIGQIQGEGLGGAVVGGEVVLAGDAHEGLLVGDLVVAAPAFADGLQTQDQMAGMIGVGGGTAGDFTQEVARHDGVGVRTADTQGRLGGDLAGAHVADFAADAFDAELALLALLLEAGETGVHSFGHCLAEHLMRGPVGDAVLRIYGFFCHAYHLLLLVVDRVN